MDFDDRRASDALLRRWARERRREDRDELVRRFRPLARKLALRYARSGDGLDDLEQIACLGLVKALDRFDPGRGCAFTSYAVPTILGELKRSFRDTAWSVHVPRSLQERSAKVRAAVEEHETLTGRTPTVGEIAGTLGAGVEDVLEAMDAAGALNAVSLSAPSGTDADEGATLLERLGVEDSGYELVEDRVTIAAALPELTDVQQEVLRLRFDVGMKQTEIAREIGVSQMQVSRVLRAGLDRLSHVANGRGELVR